MDPDLAALRAFVAVVDHGHFGDAAVELGLSQQAVSKRIARLESDLGVRLVRRTSRGTEPSVDGAAVLPAVRTLLGLADEVVAIAHRSRRPLRVDVISTGIVTTDLVHAFHQQADDVDLEVVISKGLTGSKTAVTAGTVDAEFARVTGDLDRALAWTPAYLEPLHVLAGHRHPLAGRDEVSLRELAGVTVWMPGNAPGSEWADFYDHLAAETGLRIDASGPNFGARYLIDALADADDRITFGGERTRMPSRPDVVRIDIVKPTPVYPLSLVWRRDGRHPALPALVDYVRTHYRRPEPTDVMLPAPDRAALGMHV